jgi:hypothetical protein
MEITLIAITLVAVAAAIAAVTVAWRLARNERRRSDARIAVLAAALDDYGSQPHSAPDHGLFSAAAPPSRLRLAAVAGLGALVVVTIVGAVLTISGRPESGGGTAVPAADAPRADPAPAAPLELLALAHEREAHRLTIRGIVRNPPAGMLQHEVTAVVQLYSRDGGFVASGRGPIDGPDLAPGAERAFVINVPTAADVGRYRVSFRRDDQIVPHVDRRGTGRVEG